MKIPKNQYRGFTLIELFTVVTAIAILIGIMIPILARARGASLTAQCVNNLRQIGLASFTYANENNGQLPWAFKTNHGAWSDQGPPRPPLAEILAPNMNNDGRLVGRTVYKCPALFENHSSNCSYTANSYVFGSDSWGERLRVRNLNEFIRPSTTIMIAEKNVEGGTDANKWFDNYSWHYKNAGILIDRHSGRQNILYLDGHVGIHSLNDIRTEEITGLR